VTAQAARLSARLDDLQGLGVSALDARLQEVRAGGMLLDRLTLEASGDASGARFSLAAAGELQGDFSLEADGTLALAQARSELALTRLEGEVLGEPFRLTGPGSLAFGDRLLEARALALAFGPASLTLDGRLGDGRVEAAVTARDVPLGLARLALPDSEVAGTLQLEASLSGPAERPSGRFQAEAADVRLGKDLGALPLDLRLDGSLEDGQLTTRADLSGFAAKNASAELVAPLRLSADPPGVELPADEPISGHARWSGELARVWPLVPLVGHAASGATEVDATLEGSFADPLIRGSATISGGSYENFETGTLVRDLQLEARFDGETLTLVRLAGNDGGKGSLDASGSLTMDPGRDFPVSAKLGLAGFTAMRRDDLTAAASGELRFAGDMADSLLEGTLTTAGVVIRIPDTLPPEIVDLQVIETGPEGEIGKRRERAGASEDSDIRLAVTVDMPNRVFVRGRGLETEWKGQLEVTGTTAQPVIQGELRNLRGSLGVIGKRFDLADSRVGFAGTGELVPLLDIRANHKAGDVTVVANITGTPDAPELALTSTPELPRDEILSRVLFGKTTTQLSPVQAIQLASAVSELSGGIGASGILDRTRSLLGVDVLDVEEVQGTEAGQTGAALSAGKYVTDSVFVGVKQGTTPGSSSVGVEVELTPNISIESDVGSSGESKLGVKLKWDY